MKNIGKVQVVCLDCKWIGLVDECQPDIDGEGSLGCFICDSNKPVIELSDLIDEILLYRNRTTHIEIQKRLIKRIMKLCINALYILLNLQYKHTIKE